MLNCVGYKTAVLLQFLSCCNFNLGLVDFYCFKNASKDINLLKLIYMNRMIDDKFDSINLFFCSVSYLTFQQCSEALTLKRKNSKSKTIVKSNY